METQRRQYEGQNTPLGYYRAAASVMAKGSKIVA